MLEFDKTMEVMGNLEKVIDAGEEYAKGACGMLIDMVCTRYGEDPVKFADALAEVVRQVNENMGAYQEV